MRSDRLYGARNRKTWHAVTEDVINYSPLKQGEGDRSGTITDTTTAYVCGALAHSRIRDLSAAFVRSCVAGDVAPDASVHGGPGALLTVIPDDCTARQGDRFLNTLTTNLQMLKWSLRTVSNRHRITFLPTAKMSNATNTALDRFKTSMNSGK